MTDRADFTLTQLQYFITSAEMGNISNAAQSLHASQSAVSMAIQRLERQLGTQLLFRHRTKGVSLTPSGRALLADARSLLFHARELQVRCREWQGELSGRLDVAFLHSIAPFVFPALVRKLRPRHPQLTVTVHEGTVDEVLALLRSGTCELAVTGELPGQEFAFTRLARVPVEALVAQSDPLALSGRATLRELAGRPLLVVDAPAGHSLNTALRARLFAQTGAPVPDVVQTSSMSTMLGLICAGEGFALMPRRVAATTLSGGRVVPVDILGEHPCAADVGVTTLPGLSASRRAQGFVSALYETVREVYRTAQSEPESPRRVA